MHSHTHTHTSKTESVSRSTCAVHPLRVHRNVDECFCKVRGEAKENKGRAFSYRCLAHHPHPHRDNEHCLQCPFQSHGGRSRLEEDEGNDENRNNIQTQRGDEWRPTLALTGCIYPTNTSQRTQSRKSPSPSSSFNFRQQGRIRHRRGMYTY